MTRRVPILTALGALVLLLAILALAPGASAGTSDRGSCNARIVVSVWTGNPKLSCTQNPEIQDIKIDVTICCPGACSTTQTFHRCSDSNESIQFSACGKTHTVSLNSGYWGDAVSDGEPILYSAS